MGEARQSAREQGSGLSTSFALHYYILFLEGSSEGWPYPVVYCFCILVQEPLRGHRGPEHRELLRDRIEQGT